MQDLSKFAIGASALCAAAIAAAPALAQSSVDATLPLHRTEPIFAPTTATFYFDGDYYGQHDRRSVYRRDDDVIQLQGGAVLRAAPAASVIVGGNYNHIDGRRLFPTTGGYHQDGGSAYLGGVGYLATNYAVTVLAGVIRNSIDETGLGAGALRDHRVLDGAFFSGGVDANFVSTGGRLSLFARYLYYRGSEGGSVQSDGSIRPKFTDSLGRVTVGGEAYARTTLGSTTVEPMVRAALIYDTKLQAFYTTRAAVELAAGVNIPRGSTTLALRVLGTVGRSEFRTLGVRASLYRSF